MEAPEYLICVNCETPCYTFEWQHSKLTEALCMTCGVDELDEFVTEEEFEAMASAG
jgi:hypothetical protein